MLTRLLNCKPTLPNYLGQAPKKYAHLDSNLKRKEINEGMISDCLISFLLVKYTEIERENRILLEKMSKILYKRNPSISNEPSNNISIVEPFQSQNSSFII